MVAVNGHTAGTMDYSSRLEAFRRSDAERDTMVAELLRMFSDLQADYAEKCDDYNNEVESRRMWQAKARSSETALAEQKQASGSNNFALAVLDGDGAVFQDYLLAQGNDGGAQAAHLLHTELRNQLRATYPDSNVADWSIVVHIVLNLQGLGTKLQACGLLTNPNELIAFGRGFSLAQPLFSFIDVGSGKERADHKVRETLRLFMPNAQCKHVFFGPCHDNGYLPVLETYRLDKAMAARLTLIQSTQAEPGFQKLGLQPIRMSNVFRTENLPAKPLVSAAPHQPALPVRGVSMSAATMPFVPHKPHSPSPSLSPAPSVASTDNSSWATVGKNGANGQSIDVASKDGTKKGSAKKFIQVNVHDERLDQILPDSDSQAYARFADRVKANGKCCNNYHLLGKCALEDYCDYDHGERLTRGEQLVLKHKARSLLCGQRYACRDPSCFLGHHCKFGSNCFLKNCRFSDTHDTDLEPAKRVYEDGKDEWLPAYIDKYRK